MLWQFRHLKHANLLTSEPEFQFFLFFHCVDEESARDLNVVLFQILLVLIKQLGT